MRAAGYRLSPPFSPTVLGISRELPPGLRWTRQRRSLRRNMICPDPSYIFWGLQPSYPSSPFFGTTGDRRASTPAWTPCPLRLQIARRAFETPPAALKPPRTTPGEGLYNRRPQSRIANTTIVVIAI